MPKQESVRIMLILKRFLALMVDLNYAVAFNFSKFGTFFSEYCTNTLLNRTIKLSILLPYKINILTKLKTAYVSTMAAETMPLPSVFFPSNIARTPAAQTLP